MALEQEDRITAVVQENAAAMLRLARRHSLCESDAADAYQRTLEIYLSRAGRLDPQTAGAWLRTVCKHEAMRIRAAQQRVLPVEPVEWDERPSDDVGDAADRAESLERVARAAEALGACAPDEARAILLCAGGASYADISEQCGWTYSRVSRTLAGGRARFLQSFAAVESGAACEAFEPVLSAIVDGEATPDDFRAIRPHLKHCSGCRATLKGLYESAPALGALMPAGALAGGGGWLSRWLEGLSVQVGDRVAQAQAAIELATSTKAVAVVASAATMAAGGAAVEDRVRDRPATARPVRAALTAPTVARRPTPRPGAIPTRVPRAPTRPANTPAATPAPRVAAPPPRRTPVPVATSPPGAQPSPTAAPEELTASPPPGLEAAAPPFSAPTAPRSSAPTDEFGLEG